MLTQACPIFRGAEGFWRAYPALRASGIRLAEIASPETFRREPSLAWAFYGHRLNLYRQTIPHRGFDILRKWAATKNKGAFVFTSNVDGQFQKAGFEDGRIAECHGSIHWLQCIAECSQQTWSADDLVPIIDDRSFCLISPVPTCPSCGAVARPNILMFNDSHWIEAHSQRQIRQLVSWIAQCRNLVAIELGAGRAIPTVRRFGEHYADRLIRVNPRDFKVRQGRGVGVADTALHFMERVDRFLCRQPDGRDT